MSRMEKTKILRADTVAHNNCCQSVVMTFAEEMGLTEKQAFNLGSHFAAGLRQGSVCGAMSGALMVLGALGYDEDTANTLIRNFREKHGATDCATLLKTSKERGEVKKAHCDALVFELVEALESIID